jgi:homopolymeric O-antigen transport system permease protein
MRIQHIKELYKYRNLIWILAWVDFKQRYKNSVLGYFWSLLEPLLMLAILYIVFSNIMKAQVEYYPLFLLQGIIMWNFFSRSTTQCLTVITLKPHLVQKVYFPRDILVISGCITALLMSIFESIVFLLFLLYFRIPLSLNIIFIPLIILLFFLIALGTSLALAALNVFYRDFQYIWALILQAGFFATPILYPLSIFPPFLFRILSYNPLAQIIYLGRDVTIYAKAPNLASLSYAFAVAFIALCIGYWIFMRLEPKFAEEL